MSEIYLFQFSRKSNYIYKYIKRVKMKILASFALTLDFMSGIFFIWLIVYG